MTAFSDRTVVTIAVSPSVRFSSGSDVEDDTVPTVFSVFNKKSVLLATSFTYLLSFSDIVSLSLLLLCLFTVFFPLFLYP